MSYTLYVNDNARYMDKDARYTVGEYDSLGEVTRIAKRIVDEFLSNTYKHGMSTRELWDQYMYFGEDPFIVGAPAGHFSAWEYAKQRCVEICETK